MNHKTREILITGRVEATERDLIIRQNIQVRRGVPLPDVGQRVVAMDEQRIIKFAGEVVDVDFEKYTYDVELRKSTTVTHVEVPAPSLPLKSRGAQTARDVAESSHRTLDGRRVA